MSLSQTLHTFVHACTVDSRDVNRPTGCDNDTIPINNTGGQSLKEKEEITKRSELPTFYEIKAEDLPPFGENPRKIFMLEKNSDILSAGDTEWAYFFNFDITKQHRNNETATK